jgi:NADP-dependent 3-hydroxy acid dehydrogenase YdfG
VSGQWPDASGPAYQAAKAGVIGLVRACAFEEHAQGVRFSVINPGLVDTPILDKRPVKPPPEVLAQALRPEDVAQACLFVLSLPPHVHVPELTILPGRLQAFGASNSAHSFAASTGAAGKR